MKEVHSAGGVVLNPSGEVAVVFTDTLSWQFPKGGVEVGENYLETAKREIEEETGIRDLSYVKQFPSYSRVSRNNDNVLRHIHYFFFKTDELVLVPSAEVTDALWLSLDAALEKLTYPEDREFFLGIRGEL